MLSRIFQKSEQKVEEPEKKWLPSWQFKSSGIDVMREFLAASDRKLYVLDFANASNSKLEFILKYDAVYTPVGVITQITNSPTRDSTGKLNLRQLFRHIEKYKSKRKFNLIFVWDLFSYMSRSDIIYLMAYISSHCHVGARLFAISWLTNQIPREPGLFDVTPDSKLIYETVTSDTTRCPKYSTPALVEMMPSFVPSKLSVTRSGMLEVVLEFKTLENAPDPTIIPSEQLSAHHRN